MIMELAKPQFPCWNYSNWKNKGSRTIHSVITVHPAIQCNPPLSFQNNVRINMQQSIFVLTHNDSFLMRPESFLLPTQVTVTSPDLKRSGSETNSLRTSRYLLTLYNPPNANPTTMAIRFTGNAILEFKHPSTSKNQYQYILCAPNRHLASVEEEEKRSLKSQSMLKRLHIY